MFTHNAVNVFLMDVARCCSHNNELTLSLTPLSPHPLPPLQLRARIFKLLRRPRIDSKEPRSARLCSLESRYDNPIPTRFLAPHKVF